MASSVVVDSHVSLESPRRLAEGLMSTSDLEHSLGLNVLRLLGVPA